MHTPVLLSESIDALNLVSQAKVVDATLGNGGHARQIIKRLDQRGTFIGIDIDKRAIVSFQKETAHAAGPAVHLVGEPFSHLAKILDELEIQTVDAILADLGWRIEQIKDPRYGMSFRNEAPLDMRLGGTGEVTAEHIVNTFSQQVLQNIFFQYGQERASKKIAQAIVLKRRRAPIQTTTQLAEIIDNVIGGRHRRSGIHPATKVFQALRIVVNSEFDQLESFLPQALQRLSPGGRLAIITFHSLEDRIVKHFFRTNAGGCICPPQTPICVCGKKPVIRLVHKKGIRPTAAEVDRNPRARSATLRVVEKL